MDFVKQRLLIVVSLPEKRKILHSIFSDEFTIEYSKNSAEAFSMLHRCNNVCAVLVAENDCMQSVVCSLKDDSALSGIPIVAVADSDAEQLNAIKLGVADVINEPINPQLALYRVNNAIKLCRASRQTAEVFRPEIDEKTGIYNKYGFCRRTAELLRANTHIKYVVLRWDIDRFKVFNDMFGYEAGNRLLADIGAEYRNKSRHDMIYGHWDADHFVMCMEKRNFEETGVADELTALMSKLYRNFEFVARVGVYEVNDHTLDVELMCDRALLALRSTKSNYGTRIAYYDDSMRAALIEEQEIIGEMSCALMQRQFVIYLQPQYNYNEKKLFGAEALVRWIHPVKGIILPGSFIPIMERNGFIDRLDQYVWEQVCRMQRRWIDDGVKVVPVSVNVSRHDLYNPNLCETLTGLSEKYKLDRSLLRLEITESAYIDDPERMKGVVNKLRSLGYFVQMDDFGSGYSSLNTLKDVPVDMLKLDMRFLDSDSTRSSSILASIIRMAHRIKLPVIAEGVEEAFQAEYLKSIGCIYLQGYYCARPMPVDEFEAVLQNEKLSVVKEKNLGNDAMGVEIFLSASAESTFLFNSLVGGVYIAEFDGSNVEALRVNDRFFEVVKTTREQYREKLLHIQDCFTDESREIYLTAVHNAIESGDEVCCEVCSKPLSENGEYIWTRNRMRFLAKKNGCCVLYVATENINDSLPDRRQYPSVLSSNELRHFRLQTERYSILSKTAGTITFEYSCATDTMQLYVTLPDGGVREKIIKDYRATLSESKWIDDESKPGLIASLDNAGTAPLSSTFDFRADYFGDGLRWYRAKYISRADDNGPINRIIGRADDINDIVAAHSAECSEYQIDGITGLYTKDSVRRAVERLLREKPAERFDAVFFMDIDNFKLINDTLGHFDADIILHQIGAVMRGMFRSHDILGRFGGDEFIIYLRSVGNMENTVHKADELIKKLNKIPLGDSGCVQCSIGIYAIVDVDGCFENIIRRADAALYEAKNNGKNRYAIASDSMPYA